MAGYTRQSAAEIITGATITAAMFNNEYNQIEAAFNGASGHAHDGTTGNGPPISLTTSVSGILPLANGGTGVATLTASEITQIGNIDSAVITAAQWGYLGATTAFGASLMDDADAATARATLGLVIGTNVQAYDAGLASIAGLTTSADQAIYTTGSDTYATTSLTSFGRSLIDDVDAATARATLGLVIGTNVQAFDAGLASIAGLTTSADQLIYTTASDTYATSSLTAFGRSLVDDADATTARATLGLGSLATLSSINNTHWSGDDLAVVNGGTGASDAATARTNLGLGIGTDVQAFDADTLKADETATLSAGFNSDVHALGNSGTGTVTLTAGTGAENFKTLTVTGSFTLAPQSTNSVIAMTVTNDGTGGYTITTSGYDLVSGSYNSAANIVHLFRSTVIGTTQILEILEVG